MKTDKNVQFKVTLTAEEFEILKEFSNFQEKPMAACFMMFIRDTNLFTVMGGANKAMEKLAKLKKSFRKDVEGASDEFNVV